MNVILKCLFLYLFLMSIIVILLVPIDFKHFLYISNILANNSLLCNTGNEYFSISSSFLWCTFQSLVFSVGSAYLSNRPFINFEWCSTKFKNFIPPAIGESCNTSWTTVMCRGITCMILHARLCLALFFGRWIDWLGRSKLTIGRFSGKNLDLTIVILTLFPANLLIQFGYSIVVVVSTTESIVAVRKITD